MKKESTISATCNQRRAPKSMLITRHNFWTIGATYTRCSNIELTDKFSSKEAQAGTVQYCTVNYMKSVAD